MSSRFDSAASQKGGSAAGAPDSMPPALRRRLHACYVRGSEAAKVSDFDYAHEMFSECVAHDPGNLTYVESMLNNLQRKYNNNKKGARLKGFGGKGALKRAVANKDWEEVLDLGIGYLKVNPWDVQTLRAMASACEALHYNEVELRYLKNALDVNHKNVDVNRHCAKSLARMGQFDQAIACWHRVEEQNRDDAEAPKMISELTMQKARHAGGVPQEYDRRPATPAADKTTAGASKEAAQPTSKIPLSRRQQLERDLGEDPTNIPNYLELAEIFTADGKFPEAERVLARALEASGNDLKVREQLEGAQIRGKRAQLAVAEQLASRHQTDEALELAKRMRSDLNRLEIDIYGGRVQRYPEHLGYKFELGLRLKRAGNFAEAINYLEPTLADPDRTARAALEIGECWQQTRKYQKALEAYVLAAEQFARDETGRDVERLKLAYYRAGVLAMGLKENQKASEYLSKLSEIDADYRDVAARLDTLGKIDHT